MTIRTDPGLAPADFGSRFAAWTIDAFVLFGVQWIAVIVMARQLQSAGMTTIEQCDTDLQVNCAGPNTVLWILIFVFVIVTTLGYHAWFDGSMGATPGKRRMGLRVVHGAHEPLRDVGGGHPPSIGLAKGLLRSIIRQGVWIWAFLFLAGSPISLDVPVGIYFGLLVLSLATYLVGAFAPSGLALHDLAAGTMVVPRAAMVAPAPRLPVIDPKVVS